MAAGKSLNQGTASSGEELMLCIAALGTKFTELGRFITAAFAILMCSWIARAAVDFGFVYIVVLCCLIIILMLFLWNLQLQASLAHNRWGQRRASNAAARVSDEIAHSCKLAAELEETSSIIARREAQLAEAQEKQQKTEAELEETRILLMKLSNELTQNHSIHQRELARIRGYGHGQSEGAFALPSAAKGVELEEVYRALERTKTELAEANVRLGCFDVSRADSSKRRRSV